MPANLKLNDLDVFLKESKLTFMVKRIDSKLANNDDYTPSFKILDIDISKESITGHKDYENFKKAIYEIDKYLKELKLGVKLETQKHQKPLYTSYRYPKAKYPPSSTESRDPFAEHKKVTRKMEAKKFISNLITFLPDFLRKDFFENTEFFVRYETDKTNGDIFIAPEDSLLFTGTPHLPEIYKAIKNKTILIVTYEKKYKHKITMDLHPQYLKQYNGRWFIFGRTVYEDKSGKTQARDKANLALDRIIDIDEKIIGEKEPYEYSSIPSFEYDTFFEDIVGVTHDKHWKEKETILLKVYDDYVFNLIRTKKLHHSQTESVDNQFISLKVRPNQELTTKILSYGAAIEVVEPIKYRECIASEVDKMHKRYK